MEPARLVTISHRAERALASVLDRFGVDLRRYFSDYDSYLLAAIARWEAQQEVTKGPQLSTAHMPKNRYAGRCVVCGKQVPEGKGRIAQLDQGGQRKWLTWHEEHVPDALKLPVLPEVTAEAVLRFVPRGTVLMIEIQGRLPTSKFNAFRNLGSEHGMKWDRATNANYVAPQNAANFIAALMRSDFTVLVPPEARALIEKDAIAARGEVKSAQRRIDQVQALLAKRGHKLYRYQEIGVEWLAPRTAALLCDDMGLGKTIQALVAAPARAPILVVCPAVAKGVWLREAQAWRPDLSPLELSGHGSFVWPEPGEMVIINYDILPDSFPEPPPGVVIIYDEGHMLKSRDAARTKRALAMNEAVRAQGGRTWLLTATPILGKPLELWALCRVAGVEQEAFCGWQGFLRAFQGRRGAWGGDTFERNILEPEALDRRKSVMRHRMKSDVLTDLPLKTIETVQVNIDESARHAADVAWQAIEAAGGIENVMRTVGKGMPAFEEISKARRALAVGKLPAAIELIDQWERQGLGPLVVFSAHRVIDVFAKRPGWKVISGAIKPEQRTEIEAAFQAGKLKGVAATIDSGGVAITLTRSNRVLFIDEEWTPALNIQAQDRVYRIGQFRPVTIVRMVANHALDHRLAAIIAEKNELILNTIHAARRGADEQVSSIPNDPTEVLEAVEAQSARALEALRAREERDREMRAMREEMNRLLSDAVSQAEAAKRTQRIMSAKASTLSEHEKAERFQGLIRRAIARKRQMLEEEAPEEIPRPAQTPQEVWAVGALESLADMDMDRAKVINDMGFSKADTMSGHALAALARAGQLGDLGWQEAISMARRYRRQVGDPP